MDAPSPSLLACIAKKLPIVAISRDFLAFEDDFEGPDGKTRCWVTLLPLSAGGAWVDYVYALVTLDKAATKAAPKKAKAPEPEPQETDQPVAEEIEEPVAEEIEAPVAEELGDLADEDVEAPVSEEAAEPAAQVVEELSEVEETQVTEDQPPVEATEAYDEYEEEAAPAKAAPGFSKLLDSLAGLTGFYGSQPVKVDPITETEEPVEELVEEPVAEAPEVEEPAAEEEPLAEENAPADEEARAGTHAAKPATQSAATASEGSLQSKLAQVRTEADEARQAKLRANAALYEALSAAYDFALDAEETPEEYLRLVEAQGLKIQLRSPMKPVVKLAFDGMCDEPTIKQLEAVLAWAFEQELPRGTLAEQIETAGGIGPILGGHAKAA
jgi:hypothetical protein